MAMFQCVSLHFVRTSSTDMITSFLINSVDNVFICTREIYNLEGRCITLRWSFMLIPKTRPLFQKLERLEKVASCGLYTIQTVFDYTFTRVVSVVLPVTTNVARIIIYAFSVISSCRLLYFI